MSRGGLKITSCTDDSARSVSSDLPSWMKGFASKAQEIVQAEENRQKEAVTVVDTSRERQNSIYQQMYSIMNGKKPLYSSVEEAVMDYQKKIGLNDYLQKIQSESSIKSAASQIISSASEYDENDINEKKNSESDEVLIFKIFPNTERYITNVLDTNPKLSIPAILHMIAENFEADGVDSNHLDDPGLLKYISGQILSRTKPDLSDYSGIGKDVGTDREYKEDSFLSILRDNGGF